MRDRGGRLGFPCLDDYRSDRNPSGRRGDARLFKGERRRGVVGAHSRVRDADVLQGEEPG